MKSYFNKSLVIGCSAILFHFVALPCFLSGIGNGKQSVLLQDDLVDLRGRQAVAVLRNHTLDTLYLTGFISNMIPYNEESYNLTLPPGASDSISFVLSYPEFLTLEDRDFNVVENYGKRASELSEKEIENLIERFQKNGSRKNLNSV